MDGLLGLDASSEEKACWLAVGEHDRQVAVDWVRGLEAVAAGYAKAAAAGRAEFAVLEVSCALQVDQLTAANVLADARQLVAVPQVAEAVESGRLRMPHAKALLGQLLDVDSALAGQVADEVIGKAADRSPAQLRGLAKRAVLRADREAAERRRAAAVAARRMFLRPLDDGMISMELHLRAETALRIYGKATDATRADDGSGRSADQRRVDWVAEQILREHAEPGEPSEPSEPSEPDAGPAPSDRRRRRPTQVQVVVPVAVGLGLSDEPCELVGYGPISAEHGRELLAEAELRKVCVDSRTGQVIAADDEVVRPVPQDTPKAGDEDRSREQALAEATRDALVTMVLRPSFEPAEPEHGYRPSASLRRTVGLRDVTCDFPFASTAASRCDLDHTRPYARGGQTSLNGLAARSRRIHRGKQAGWTPGPDADGSMLWQSPSGASYRRPPPREKPPTIPPDARLQPPRPPERKADPPPVWLTDAPDDQPTDTPGSTLPADPLPAADDPPPF